jgi:hypothetical protein
MSFKKCWDDFYSLDGTGGDSAPEGTAAEWREIVTAIRARASDCPGVRLGMIYSTNNTRFYSPRNSEDYGRYYTDAEIDALATEIESVLGEN